MIEAKINKAKKEKKINNINDVNQSKLVHLNTKTNVLAECLFYAKVLLLVLLGSIKLRQNQKIMK